MARFAVLVAPLALLSICVDPDPPDLEEEGGRPGDGEEYGDGDKGECEEPSDCEQNDDWEPNDLPETAAAVPWDEISMWGDSLRNAFVVVEAYLCAGEDDWYYISVEELGFDEHVAHIDGLATGASWCGHLEFCDGDFLPGAPENSMQIEVYDAETMALLADELADNGRVDINGFGEAFSKDLLIHVHAPTAAAFYGYELYVDIRSFDGEDECEC